MWFKSVLAVLIVLFLTQCFHQKRSPLAPEFSKLDSLPEADDIVIIGDKAYVSLQRLDTKNGWIPDTAKVLVINTLNDSVEHVISLKTKNPKSMIAINNQIYIASTGSYSGGGGGIEVLDATNNSTALLVDESIFGSKIEAFALSGPEKGYVVVGTYGVPYKLVSFNPATGQIIHGQLPSFSGLYTASIKVYNNRLYVCDRDTVKPGLLIYDVNSDTLISGPLSTGLSPNSAAFTDSFAMITTSNYQNGNLSRYDLAANKMETELLPIDQDNDITSDGNSFFILQKFPTSSIIKIKVASPAAVLWQYSTGLNFKGEGTNPSSLGFINPTKTYLTLYGHFYILIINPAAEKETDFIRDSINILEYQ